MAEKQQKALSCHDPRALAGLAPSTPLLVALSGGADSVALLALMAKHPPVYAVHVHHGIRGGEADRDAAFCSEIASRLGVPLETLYIDVPALAAKSGESLETAARDARYEAITRYMKQKGLPLLVTAHHADDQLETMLQHLLRGSGTRGLCGIPAVRELAEGIFVARPLLDQPKEAILAFLESEELSFVTDSTNEEPCCQRNLLRLRVLPLLKELQPSAPQLAARCASSLAGDEAYLDGLAADFLEKEGREPTVAALLSLPRPIFVRVLRRLLPVVPTTTHIDAIHRLLCEGKPHAALSLPPSIKLQMEGGRLLMLQKRNVSLAYKHILTEGINKIKEADALIVVARSEDRTITPPDANLYKYTTKLSLNSTIIKGAMVARPRSVGDRVLVGGMHRAVRRLASLSHLPLDTRRSMPLLADDDGVLAVPFFTVRDGGDKDTDLTVTFYFN